MGMHKLEQNDNAFNLEYEQDKRERFTTEYLMNLEASMLFVDGFLRSFGIFDAYVGAHGDIKALIWRYIESEDVSSAQLKNLMKENKKLANAHEENEKNCKEMEQMIAYLQSGKLKEIDIETNESMDALQKEFDKNKLNEQKLLRETEELQKENDSIKENVDEMMVKYNALTQSDELEASDFMNWSQNRTLSWILSLDNGEFMQYDLVLMNAFKNNEIDGEYLPNVTKKEIEGWGIKNFKHRQSLFRHIQNLVKKE